MFKQFYYFPVDIVIIIHDVTQNFIIAGGSVLISFSINTSSISRLKRRLELYIDVIGYLFYVIYPVFGSPFSCYKIHLSDVQLIYFFFISVFVHR